MDMNTPPLGTPAPPPAVIRAAAVAYNIDFPKAAAEIEAGSPVVDVAALLGDAYGRTLRFVITVGIVAPDGGFIAAGEPVVDVVRRTDGRVGRDLLAERRYRRLSRSDVPLRVRVVGC